MFLRASITLGVLLTLAVFPPSLSAANEIAPDTVASKRALYDPDPNHLWNRLHRTLFVRAAVDGTEYGFDTVDPLLWAHTKFLLEGASHESAVKLLDEFLSTHGENLIPNPLKRAMLQRDLWAVFDWMSGWPDNHSPESNARHALQKRLATAIQRLALTREQIDALPDNYSEAVRSHQFKKVYNTDAPSTPFLPADLFFTNGSWVCVGLGWEERVAPMHVSRTGGRSAFLVFMQTPGGRVETTNYLRRFREVAPPYVYRPSQFNTNEIAAELTPDLPQFPNGTQFALVRQTILLDRNGELRPTHLTESVQIRRYNDVSSSMFRPSSKAQTFFEFQLSRERLFAGTAGGLRAAEPGEKKFLQFMDKGFDAFESTAQRHESLSHWLRPALDCAECHGSPGVYSVNSFVQNFSGQAAMLPHVSETSAQGQRNAARIWKQQQFSFGLLQGLWEEAR